LVDLLEFLSFVREWRKEQLQLFIGVEVLVFSSVLLLCPSSC